MLGKRAMCSKESTEFPVKNMERGEDDDLVFKALFVAVYEFLSRDRLDGVWEGSKEKSKVTWSVPICLLVVLTYSRVLGFHGRVP